MPKEHTVHLCQHHHTGMKKYYEKESMIFIWMQTLFGKLFDVFLLFKYVRFKTNLHSNELEFHSLDIFILKIGLQYRKEF